MLRGTLLFVLCCTSIAVAQPTPCPAGIGERYAGPCYHGALPAFFDDFEYDTARTAGPVQEALEGDLFGPNRWHLREGTEQTRAWHRFNRSDLPIPGSITFVQPSVIRMQLPEGLASTDYSRASIISTEFTAEGGTYTWCVRLSELWAGQRVRQAIWTHSNSSYVFDRVTPTDTTRAMYWSELDFENENHFQGERRNGVFVPDYVTRMSVGSHFGQLYRAEGSRRLSADGPVPGEAGRGKLVRNGPGRGAAARDAPLIPSWADLWLYLIINVDEEQRSVTYRMIPEQPLGALRALEDESVTVGSSFYPLQPTHPALSVHWIAPQGTLRHPLYLEADWFYYSPVAGLSIEDVLDQVDRFRQRHLSRLNTTGERTFQGYRPTQPLQLTIKGPREVACGEEATWMLSVRRLGRYHVTYRYRILRPDGSYKPWQNAFERKLILVPQRGQAGIEMEATAQDLWSPHGVVEGTAGWDYPHPKNDQEQTRFTARFDCGAR